ncbi:MAG: class I SAM-dependent methyltransferase [Planctomycetota bacterium]|nr:class I SAM-dependent methyltransferase [Planctomycetota bacterium]
MICEANPELDIRETDVFTGEHFNAARLSRIAVRLFQHAPFVARKFQCLRPYICPFERFIEFVPQDAEILDIGCGAGLFLTLLAETRRIRSGTGFDSSRSAIAIAEAASQRVTGNVVLDFSHRGVQDAWPDGEFDVVSLIDVMHHVPPRWRADLLTQAVSRVRPGGWFIYKDMCRRPLWRAWMNRLHDLVVAKEWIRYEPLDNVRSMVVKDGMECLRVERINRLWYGHELLWFRRPVEA